MGQVRSSASSRSGFNDQRSREPPRGGATDGRQNQAVLTPSPSDQADHATGTVKQLRVDGRCSRAYTATNLHCPVRQAGAIRQHRQVARRRPAGQHRVAGLIDGPDVPDEQGTTADDLGAGSAKLTTPAMPSAARKRWHSDRNQLSWRSVRIPRCRIHRQAASFRTALCRSRPVASNPAPGPVSEPDAAVRGAAVTRKRHHL
jgi:hypothetical protein